MIYLRLKKSITCCLLLLMLFLAFPFNSSGQGKGKDIVDIEKKADKMYRQQQYVQAKDLYSTLLSNYPKDPFYSFRFGVCLLYGDRRNLEKPLQFLELAAKAPGIDNEVFYYLGQAYHFNYRFTDAIRLYQKYRGLVSNNKAARKDVDRQIEMCQNGLFLLSKVKDLYVLDRKEVKRADFFRTYDLTGFGGEILQEPPVFKSKLDRKKEITGLVFFPKKQDLVLFASYGPDGKNGKDIYYSSMLPDMTWSKPQRLPGAVNTPYDEDYPYLLPDGRTLYFASKGHNSMGGYDIFRSTLDTVTGLWKEPENLDFAINTPFDDVLFVTDPYQHYAYFSSNRSSVGDDIMVFMVRVDKRPDKIQEISLDQPLAGTGAEDEKVKRSVEMVKEMANLTVNAKNDNFKDTLAAIAVAEELKPKPQEKAKFPAVEFSEVMKDKVMEKENVQIKVDSAFTLVGKMEESIKKIDKVSENVQKVSLLTTDKQQKEMADRVLTELSKESNKKQNKLKQARSLSGTIQQLAATGKTDSAKVLYQTLTDKIVPSDTASDYQTLVKDIMTGKPIAARSQVKDDFMSGVTPLKTKQDKEAMTDIMDMAASNEITFDTKVITQKDEEEAAPLPTPEVANEEKQPGVVKPVTTPPEAAVVAVVRNPEMVNRILNSLIAQKDTLNRLLIKTQRQKLVLLSNALNKSNESGSKLNEVGKLNAVLETVITEGSVRDMKRTIKKLQSEGAQAAEEAVLDYTLAAKLGERERTIGNALKELESQAITIERAIDSGKVEKAGIMADMLVDPIKNFALHCNSNDDIIASTHRQARDLKISVLTNFKQARQLAVSAKSASDMALNLKKQADAHMDKEASKKLLNEAEKMDQQAADRQREAIEIFNQNIIWQNRSKALEDALPKGRLILESIEDKVTQEHFKQPGKKIKDTTLLIPVMLDLLANNLPQNDTTYEKLTSTTVIKNQPQPKVTEEILRRTEFVANVDDKLLAAQQQRKQDRPDRLEFRKIDEKELGLREKLAMLNDTVGKSQPVQPRKETVAAPSQWELDKPSFVLLKSQVDTLYNKIKKQPQLQLPSTMKGLFEELTMLTDSLGNSFNNYRKARMAAAGKQDTARIAMSLELEAFEVKATANRLGYLVNRLKLNELSNVSSNPELNARPQPDSLIAVEYFYAADSIRDVVSQTKDKKRQLRLLRQADELEKNGINEQLKLAEKIKEGPQEAVIAVAIPDKTNQEINKKPEIKSEPGRETVAEPKPVEKNQTKPEPVKEIKPEAKAVVKETTPAKPQPKPEPVKEIKPEVQVVVKETTPAKTQITPEPVKEIKPETLAVVKEKAPIKNQIKPEPAKEARPETPVTVKTTPPATKPSPTKIFASVYVDRSPVSLSQKEISTVENEIAQASEQKSLPYLPGLMYSVQVGVYKTRRVSAQLFNINPLFEDIMNNGNYRYFSGIFGERNDAVNYKNAMVQKGVADAFVVIFYKGKRITQAEAAALTGEAITKVIPQSKIDQLSKQKVSGEVRRVYFSVQLAAYRRTMTENEIAFYQQKVNATIQTATTETGLIVLTTGEFNDYNSSLEARKLIVAQGIKDAFIVGFIDGKRVMAYQARQALIPAP